MSMLFQSRIQIAPLLFVLALAAALCGAEDTAMSSVDDQSIRAAAEARYTLDQVARQMKQVINDNRLDLIHDEDLRFRVAATALLAHGDLATVGKQEVEASLKNLNRLAGRIHAAGDAGDGVKATGAWRAFNEALSAIDGMFPMSVAELARSFQDLHRCPMHPEIGGESAASCSKCGMSLVPVKFSFADGNSSAFSAGIVSTVIVPAPLRVGVRSDVIVRLTKPDGSPVLANDLEVAHTQRIHLLIIDPSLIDYHHEHPSITPNHGEYAFGFTPTKPGLYRMWADLLPIATARQEYAVTDIPGAGEAEPLSDRAERHEVTVDSLRYVLTLAQPRIKAGQAVAATLRITTADGQPFTELEPIMATFAHLVGFYDDFKTVLHIHPLGEEPTNAAQRGGPELHFKIFADRPGFIRLFAQVQILGVSKFAPFGITVEP
jgi:hypothetical protein